VFLFLHPFSFSVRSSSCCVLHACLPKPLLTHFQVREARTHSCNAFYGCFRSCAMNLWLIWCSGCLVGSSVWFWFGLSGYRRETAARSDNLVQASPSRLGEMSRGSPKLFAWRVAQATRSGFERANVSLRRGKSRLSENTRRAPVLCVELSPRRRELAWARVVLAWARPFSLSDELGETACWFDNFSILERMAYIKFVYFMMVWGKGLCMCERVYELWVVNLNDSWHVMNMEWLVMKMARWWGELI